LQKALHIQVRLVKEKNEGGSHYRQRVCIGRSEVMKTLQVDDTLNSMLVDIGKKHNKKPKEVLESLIYSTYDQMKRTGRKVL